MKRISCFAAMLLSVSSALVADELPLLDSQPVNTWIKRSPSPDGPVSPRLGYEGACVWDSRHRLLIRYGGHNQGGGGEQDVLTATTVTITRINEWLLHGTGGYRAALDQTKEPRL